MHIRRHGDRDRPGRALCAFRAGQHRFSPPGQSGRPADGTALELGLAAVKGRSAQTLGSGQRVKIGDESFSGPLTLENETKATVFDGASRWRRFTDSRVLGIELLGGFGGIWRMRPGTTLQARYSVATSVSHWLYETDVHRVELAPEHALGAISRCAAAISSGRSTRRPREARK